MTEAENKPDSQNTPHTSPSRASYGVSIVRILEKPDNIITASHYTRVKYLEINQIKMGW